VIRVNLTYERFTEKHFQLWDKHLLQDPKVMKYVYDYKTGLKKLPYYVTHWEKHGFGWYSVFYNNDFAGRVGLFWNDDNPPKVEIGYTLANLYWGKGIATDACNYLLREFKKRNICKTVIAKIELENIASIQLAKKLGFQLVNSNPVKIEGNSNELYIFNLDLDASP
jgi:ribosomal-protein-alanine N-acetyltransferase